jgi:pantoate--beta-alanine ligase
MEIIQDVTHLRHRIAHWRTQSATQLALVPTMGALHAGHLSLANTALSEANRVVVSIFVNPLQFAPHEDFDHYPRTLEQDAQHLEELGVDALFVPTEQVMYPTGRTQQMRITVPDNLGGILCGRSRPGFFNGVATVVAKLFNLVTPDLAIFGAKDYQQLLVIQRLVADFNWSIRILSGAIVREADGLAMSSRNAYLTPSERACAPMLYQTLQQAAGAITQGKTLSEIEANCHDQLCQHGFKPDYISIRRQHDLQIPDASDQQLIILAAAWLGNTRLIDNYCLVRPAVERLS